LALLDLDAYDRGARLAPAYLVFAPAAVFVVALALGSSEWWSKIAGVLVGCGAPAFAAHWGRSGGRRKQLELFTRWGGAPTTQLLRFRTGGSATVVSHRHDVVARATGFALPSAAEEEAGAATADDRYEIAVTALRERTRDVEQFPLVLKENIGYGFCRNLWGRKPYGIAIALLALAASGALLIAAAVGHGWESWPAAAVAAGFAALALVVWLAVVTPAWVGEAGEAYATRLLESAERVIPTAKQT
jgi:hypothetical protein